jgi:hypothetical protein
MAVFPRFEVRWGLYLIEEGNKSSSIVVVSRGMHFLCERLRDSQFKYVNPSVSLYISRNFSSAITSRMGIESVT